MKKRKCNICQSDMIKKYTESEGLKYYCSTCGAFTLYSEIDESAYCDVCNNKLQEESACGCMSFFCTSCNTLKSKSTIIWK